MTPASGPASIGPLYRCHAGIDHGRWRPMADQPLERTTAQDAQATLAWLAGWERAAQRAPEADAIRRERAWQAGPADVFRTRTLAPWWRAGFIDGWDAVLTINGE